MSATSICNVCCRNDDICINLQNNHGTVLTVSDITRLPSWSIREILASVCSTCLVYISAISESSSKLRVRCEQAMHNQSVAIAPPTPDTSPNNFLQVSTKLLEEQQQQQCYAPGYGDDTANDLPLAIDASYASEPPSPLPLTLDDMTRSPSPNNAGQNSMLTIAYEQPVSPLNTESGGGGNNKKRSYQRVKVIPVQMICAHCNRAYWRKDYYRKHKRRCSAKYRSAKSVMSQQSRSMSRLELDAISVASEGNEQITIAQRPRKFRCNTCAVTVDSIGSLKQHKLIHLPHYFCDICNSEYTSQNEYEFHRAQCMAKMEVFQKALMEIKTDFDPDIAVPTRRKTRSISRALSVAPSLAPSSVASTTKKKPSAKRSRKRAKKIYTNERTTNIDERYTITNYVKRQRDLRSTISKASVMNSDDDASKVTSECSGYDDDDDDVSVVDTLYSKRLSLTNRWVEEQSHLSQYDSNINEDKIFTSLKEYDLYLLQRLKNEVKAHFITCFMPNCSFNCATLNELMIHDYMYHYKKPWFYCRKCNFCFTSKVFLDYHLDLQNKGRYVCYKCSAHFEYQHGLDNHLIQHNRLDGSGGKKHVCRFCNFEFLDEDKLLSHCHHENHNWNKKRRIIEIDRSMTISNKVPQTIKNEYNSKSYQVKIINMTLKLMPSKRCTPMEKYRFHLPYLRIQSRIGQVEFRYQTNPNCVGCL